MPFRRYLTKEEFKRAGIFNYRAYLLVRLMAILPRWKRFGLSRLRRNSNKVLMYMMQTHMLHQMFVEDKRWIQSGRDKLDTPRNVVNRLEMAAL